LAENKTGLTALAAAITDSQVAPQSIPADVEERLWKFLQFKLPTPTSAGPKLSAAGDLAATFDVYREGLAGEIDKEVGRKVFQRVCSACHRVGEVGNQVGPELKSLIDKSAEQILISIIDPNREVDPRYRMVQIETMDGRLLAGILEQETESDLTLVDNQGKPHRVARDEIEQLQTRNQSLMPTGLDREITVDQMRHLIGLLKDPS
jgi:putative heme-binding domain-containing protein